MRDPYTILGLAKTASIDEIKKAYRKLAKANHPDQTKDPRAKERFNEATLAYDLLGDGKKRAAFDRGEIDAEGKPRFQGFEGAGAGRRPPGFENFEFNMGGGRGGAQGFDPGDIFADLFAGAGRAQTRGPGGGPRPRQPANGADVDTSVTVSLQEAAKGTSARVTLPGSRTLEVRVPAGMEDGKQIRLKGQGQPGVLGGEAGDALVTVRIAAHPLFKVEGRDLVLDWPVTLYEAALGAKIEVPTLDGLVEIGVPPGAHRGKAVRLRGKGLPNPAGTPGDMFVTLRIALPEALDADLLKAIEKMRDREPYAPRKGLG